MQQRLDALILGFSTARSHMATSLEDRATDLTLAVQRNLQYQHDWTCLELCNLPGQQRPLIRGLPPKRLYVHPDDQIMALDNERATGERVQLDAEVELVLAVHLTERWSLARFAGVFDAMHGSSPRGKRILLATLHNDSTVVYYVMHEGMIKPRQN